MAKKRFRPRSGGGGGGRSGGYGGGYYSGGGNGGGGGRGSRGWWTSSAQVAVAWAPVIAWIAHKRRPFPSTPIEGMEGEPTEELAPEYQLGPDGEPMLNEEGQPIVITPTAPQEPQLIDGLGLLEMHPNGYGFLRSPENNYSRERTDPFVPGTMIERYGLRQGCSFAVSFSPAVNNKVHACAKSPMSMECRPTTISM